MLLLLTSIWLIPLIGLIFVLLLAGKLKAEWVFGIALFGLWVFGFIENRQLLSAVTNSSLWLLVSLILCSSILAQDPFILRAIHKISSVKAPFDLLGLSLMVGLLSSLVSNTAVVAVLMEPVKRFSAGSSRTAKTAVFLSYFAILGGTLTLIGTSTHLVVHAIVQNSGLVGFTFWTPFPVGILLFIGGLVYVYISEKYLSNKLESNQEHLNGNHKLSQEKTNVEDPVNLPVTKNIQTEKTSQTQLAALPPINIKSPFLLLLLCLTVVLSSGLGGYHIALYSFVGISLFLKKVTLTVLLKAIPFKIMVVFIAGLCLSGLLKVEFIDFQLSTKSPFYWGLFAYVALFFATLLLTEAVSNYAAAAFFVPIALAVAQALSLNEWPFIMAVTFASSASFLTTHGYQTNMMVAELNGLTNKDFVRFGKPFSILYSIIALISIPIFFPFR